ncbi:MAG: hypothetical protein ABII23_09495 [bacterium]
MMYLSSSELKQIEFLKKKMPAERFFIMAQLIGDQFEIMKAGIRYKNYSISEEELDKCLKKRMKKIYSLKR